MYFVDEVVCSVILSPELDLPTMSQATPAPGGAEENTCAHRAGREGWRVTRR